MFTPARALALSDSQKSEVEALVRNGQTPQKVVSRLPPAFAGSPGWPGLPERQTQDYKRHVHHDLVRCI